MTFKSSYVLMGLLSLLAMPPARAAVITIVNVDGPGEGFNDPTPAAPVGGNDGATVGEQRLNVFRRAGEIWGAKLSSPVDIEVWAKFDPLTCDNTSATLGQARAFTFFRDFAGAPRPGTLYPVALGNKYAGLDLDPPNPDIIATFNSSLGQSGCLPTAKWYYGLDRTPGPNTYDLLDVVLHELAHGLGFTTLVDLNTGAKSFGFDDAYMLHLEDHSTGRLFPVMSNAERLAAMKDTGDLHWTGPAVVSQSGFLAAGRHASGHVEIYAPSAISPGSSITHFSNTLFPDELMEPFLSSHSDDRLATALLADLGWTVVDNAPSILAAGGTLAAEGCPPGNGAIDPGEAVTFAFQLRNSGVGVTGNLVATLLPSDGVAFPGPPQSYGALAAGGSAVARPFTFTAAGSCGQTITATLQLIDGAEDLGTVSFPLLLGTAAFRTVSATNASAIDIPATGRIGQADPYPSTLTVSGVSGPVRKVTVTLRGLTHGLSADVDVLLTGPGGQAVLLMSDTGNSSASQAAVTLDDEAAAGVPLGGPVVSGTYRPTNLGTSDSFPAPAPASPYDSALGVFTNAPVNGPWRLYIVDDRNQNSGSLSGGWSIQFTIDQPPQCCRLSDLRADAAALASLAPNPVAAGSNVVCSILVTNAGPDMASGISLFSQPPPGLSFQSVQSSQGDCAISNGALNCQLGSLPALQTIQLALHCLAQTPGMATLQAVLVSQSTDLNPANDTAAAVLSIAARPTLSKLPDQALLEDASTLVLPVTVGDPDTPAGALTLSARLTNSNLLSSASALVGGSESNRTITLTPAPDQFGSTAVFLTVSDGTGTDSDLFFLTVTSVNDPPTFAPGPDLVVAENAGAQTVPQWARAIAPGPTNESSQTVAFIVASDAPNLFSAPPALAADGTLTFTAAPGARGIASATAVLQDNGGRLNQGLDESPPRAFTISIIPIQDVPPRIESIRYGLGAVTLTWEAVAGRHYRVQFKTSLLEADWDELEGDVEAHGPKASATDSPDGPQRFYRVLLLP